MSMLPNRLFSTRQDNRHRNCHSHKFFRRNTLLRHGKILSNIAVMRTWRLRVGEKLLVYMHAARGPWHINASLGGWRCLRRCERMLFFVKWSCVRETNILLAKRWTLSMHKLHAFLPNSVVPWSPTPPICMKLTPVCFCVYAHIIMPGHDIRLYEDASRIKWWARVVYTSFRHAAVAIRRV